MASLLSWGGLAQRAKALAAQVNPLDNGRTYNTVMQNRPPPQAPVRGPNGVLAPASAWQQLTHSGLTNSVGNMAVKPFVVNPLEIANEAVRQASAGLTGNQAALNAANTRQFQNLKQSVPGWLVQQADNAGAAGYNLAFKAPILDLKGNAPAAERARTVGLNEFNRTAPGQLVAPLQRAIAAAGHASNAGKAQIGLDPNATFAQKFIGDPVVGALGTLGAAKGIEGTGKAAVKGGKAVVAFDKAQGQEGFAKVPGKPTQGAKPNVPEVPKAKVPAPAQVPLKLSRGLENSKMPGALKRALISSTGFIHNLGEGGREIAKRVSEQRFQSETRQAAFYKQIPTVMKLNKDQFRNFVDTLDNKGKAQKGLTLHPDVAKAVGEWQKAIVDIPKQAGAAGIDMGNLGKNYFPRIHKDLFATGKGEARMLDKIIEQQKTLGKDINRGDATTILNKMRKGYNKEYGNLTKSRTGDLPGYEKTHDAMTTYIDKAFGHITHAEQFGPKDELLSKLVDNISRQGHQVGSDSVVGKHLETIFDKKDKQSFGYKASSGVRQFNAYRSLSSAAISNATQLTNTATVAGVGRTAKGIFKLATSKEARDRARASGVLIDHAIKNLSTQQLGVGGRIARNVASPFFQAVEKFNRETTAIVGHDYGNHLAAKAAKGNAKALDTLRNKFGIEGPIGKTLTDEQSMKMSSKLVEISQFKVDPQDLPNWVDSPLGKVAAQFRTFGYKQTGFMWNQVLREAQKGNFLPLARFTAVGVPGGVASASLKAAAKGQAQPQTNDKKKLALSGFNAVGGFGLPGSAAQSVANGNKYGDTLGAIGSFIGGPTAGFVDETRKNISNAQGGKSKGLIKEGVRSIPAVGPFIANKTMPTAPAPLKPSDQTPANASPQQKMADTKAEKKALEADPNVGNGDYLRQLPDGQYAYYVDGDTKPSYTKDIKTARNAIAENSLKQSGDSYKVVGETVYRKGADGTVTPTTKTKFDYQIGTQMLEAYKNADDLNGWMATANDQIASIDKQLKDPSIDPLDQITLENDKASLQKNIDKYAGYGGFTKGKKAKSVSSASFKTASSTSIPKPKGISVRVSQAKFKAPTTRKLSVSKLPSNYLTKKLS